MRPFANYGDERLPSRFWEKVSPYPMSGCWLWTAGLNEKGYGQFNVKQIPRRAHRVAYETLIAAVPAGLELDHLCRTRSCCNPAHLESVTHKVNSQRGEAGKYLAQRTHCKNGHALTEANVYQTTRTGTTRHCRICAADRVAKHYKNQNNRNRLNAYRRQKRAARKESL